MSIHVNDSIYQQPAPILERTTGDGKTKTTYGHPNPGITKLEYLVAKNVAALVASGDHTRSSHRLIVGNAIDLAYETINQLNELNPK